MGLDGSRDDASPEGTRTMSISILNDEQAWHVESAVALFSELSPEQLAAMKQLVLGDGDDPEHVQTQEARRAERLLPREWVNRLTAWHEGLDVRLGTVLLMMALRTAEAPAEEAS